MSIQSAEEGSIYAQGSNSYHQEEGLPGLCALGPTLWCRVLDSPQETHQEDQHIPSQVYQNHPRDIQPAAVVQAHHHERGKEAMGR